MRASPTLNLASAGIALVAVCYGLARFGYGFFTPIFRAEFNLSPASIGFFAPASYFAYCLTIFAGTTLTSRFGARKLVICSGMIAAAAMALIAIAPKTTALGLGVAATGLCTGLVSPPLTTVIAENVAVTYQHRVQTMVNSGAGIGIIISVPLALAASTQWRTAWLLFAALAILSTLWIAKATPKPPARRNPGPPGGQASALERFSLSPLLPSGTPRLLLAAAGLGAMSTAVLNFGIDFKVQAGGQSSSATTVAWVPLGGPADWWEDSPAPWHRGSGCAPAGPEQAWVPWPAQHCCCSTPAPQLLDGPPWPSSAHATSGPLEY
ncbi:MFS transporter [Glutamicibacter sp. TV12E]|uniref:MFS transporter n=1 Tax=Glutamicibacter sp. TV12E TaxID=3446362 RepID=UPI00403462BF